MVMCKIFPCGSTDFEGMKVSWKATEACYCVRKREAIGEGAALDAVRRPKIKVVIERI